MNIKKFVLAVGFIVVLAAGFSVYGYLANKPDAEAATKPVPQTAPPPQEKPATGIATVVYDENGFSPKEITVAKGTTVNFDNRTEIPMWVASDPHPDHTNYPELDAINVNGQYPEPKNDFSFTFAKSGTWTYHNHTMPEHMAKVTVE